MKTIITGGTGLIGRALAAHLADNGHEVVALTRDPGRARGSVDSRAKLVRWDGRSADGWGEHAADTDAIVNLAGENIGGSRWTEAFKKRVVESRLNAAAAVVDAVARASVKPKVVVQASGIGAYGDTGDAVVDEESPLGAGFLADVVRRWEPAIEPVKEHGVRVCAIRTGVVLAAGGGALPQLTLPFKLFAGGTIGAGRNWMPWIHLADQVRAIAFLIETESLEGPVNLCAPSPVRAREFNRLIGKAMRRPSWLPVPAFAVRTVLGEMADELILSGQNARPRKLTDAGFVFRFAEAGEALVDLLG